MRKFFPAGTALTAGLLTIFALAITGFFPTSAHAVGPNLVAAATQPPNPLAPGSSAVSTLSITNTGDADSVPTVVTITYARASTLAGITRTVTVAGGIPCVAVTPRYGSPHRNCTIPALTPGTKLNVATYKATGPLTVPFTGASTSVSITGPTNSQSALFRFIPAGAADLSGSVGGGGLVFVGAASSTYGTIGNNGYSPTGAFQWHVDFPAGSSNVVPAAIANTTCNVVGSAADCTTTNLGNGAAMIISFAFNAPAVAGTYNTSMVLDTTNSVIETDETNNTSLGVALTVTGLGVNFGVAVSQPLSANRNTVFQRSVTVNNSGGSDALNVSFIDHFTQFPFVAAVSGSCSPYITHSGRPSTAHYNGVTCSLGTVAAGSSATLTYALTVPNALAAAAFTDSVSVATTSFQQPSSAPTATGSITVTIPSGPIAATNTALPLVSGNAVLGNIVSTTQGTWVGSPTISYSFQWLRCNVSGSACTPIVGATASTYTVQQSDVGSTLRASVIATNGAGPVTAQSLQTSLIIGSVAPTNTITPTLIPGLEKQPGFAWSVGTGTWSGTPTISYTYQWTRCNIGGGGCIDIVGATASSYVLQTADVFHSVQVKVTATNSAGGNTALSDASPEIDPFG